MKLTVATLTTVLAVAVASTGCKRKDPEKCQQALSTVRQGLEARQVSEVSTWRDYAYKHCEDPAELKKLDDDIVAKKKAIEEEKVAAEAFKKEQDRLLSMFKDFVAGGRSDPKSVNKSAKCPEDDEEGWCKGERWINRDKNYKIDVRWWSEEPEAFSFRTRTLGKRTCEALGGHSVARTWGESPKWAHCKLKAAPLDGLDALVSWSDKQSTFQVFSAKYLERDSKLMAQVGGG